MLMAGIEPSEVLEDYDESLLDVNQIWTAETAHEMVAASKRDTVTARSMNRSEIAQGRLA